MATAPSLRAARRDPDGAILGGVCAGLARALGIDALVVRIAFVVAATAGGLGLLAYALAWALMPQAPGGAGPAATAARRGSLEVAVGAGLLLLSGLLALRAAGFWISDALVWPLLLVATGGALIWHRQPGRAEGAAPEPEPTPVGEVRRRAAIRPEERRGGKETPSN
jgi:phage shock protein PspC (stress-responsive transcriptional regulator)